MLILDNQGLCWKSNRWFIHNDGGAEIHSKKGSVYFDETQIIFILSKEMSWLKASKMLYLEDRYCVDFTYDKKEKGK